MLNSRIIFLQLWFVVCFNLFVLVKPSPFPFIFPLLSTGWYYKPGPTESIILGLLVVKLLALRLGATVAGVPYHLNDIFDSNVLPFTKRGKRSHVSTAWSGVAPLAREEIQALERILLALRRIDSHDCFIRYICEVHQSNSSGESTTHADKTWLNVFKYAPKSSQNSTSDPTQPSIWNIYSEAMSSNPTNCAQKYTACPLTEADLTQQSLISGLF